MKKKTLIAVLIVLIVIIAIIVTLVIKTKNTDSTDTVNENETTTANTEVSEDYFEWEDNIIVGLTEEGMKQTTLVIPERCEGFESGAFSYSEMLTTVTFENDEVITDLNSAFMACTSLENISLPTSLTIINDAEFNGCVSLLEIVIPSNVKEVEQYAFLRCESLRKVVFEGGTEVIGASAFYGLDALEEIVFCDSISTVEKHAFDGCSSVTSLTLPEGLKTVEKYAFYQMGLEEIIVPEGVEVESVDDTAFWQRYVVPVYVTEGSWADENFNEIFHSDTSGAYEKMYQ